MGIVVSERCLRNWGVTLCATLLLVVLLQSCGGEPSDSAAGDPAEKLIRVAMRRLPPGMADPAAHSGQPSVDIWPAFYDGLTSIDADGNVQPWLATAWRLHDERTWRLTLRQGVRFSNGEPFDAHAVQSSVDNILFGYGARDLVRNSLLPTVAAARVIDDYTIDLVTYEPDPFLPKRLSQFYPLPPKYFAEVGPQQFARQPIGTGPFVVESWGVSRVVMRANRSSWRPPLVDTLEFIEIPDLTARRQAIESLQVHVAQYLSPDDVADLRAQGIEVRSSPEPRLRLIPFVVRPGSPLQSAQVRLALNHAVNKAAIVKALLADAPVATQLGTRASDGFDRSLEPFAYDPARAKQLLAAAGYGDGLSLDVEVLASTNTDRSVFEAVAADLRDVGVRTTLNAVEFERWRANLLSGKWHGDMFTWSASFDPVLDISRIWQYLSCGRPRPPFCQPELSELVHKRAVELDPEVRARQMARINELIRQDPPAILLHELTHQTGIRGIRGYEVQNLVVHWDKLDLQ